MESPKLDVEMPGPTEAKRVKGFATFFKSYMSVSTLVVAALPIPVGYLKLIPTFEMQRSYLSVYTSLFCFLSLGFIFFQRHRLGHYMFRGPRQRIRFSTTRVTFSGLMISFIRGAINWLPLACILLSVVAVFRYHKLLDDAVLIAQAQATAEAQKSDLANAFVTDIAEGDYATKVRLANTVLLNNSFLVNALRGKSDLAPDVIMGKAEDRARFYAGSSGAAPVLASIYVDQKNGLLTHFAGGELVNAQRFLGTGVPVPSPDEVLKRKIVPLGNMLMLWYLIIFIAAEAAFVLMALKEYLQVIVNIQDISLMGLEVSSGS